MSKKRFARYELHYARMDNKRPSLTKIKPSRSTIVEEFGGYLPEERSISILDCGCGMGHKLYLLNLMGYKDLTGIELVKEQADIAREELKGKAAVHNSDAFDWLPLHKGKFDVVLCYDVLEHIPIERVIEFGELMHDSLKSGGIAFFRVPNMSAIVAQYSRYLDITHVTGYTEFSLMQLLDIAGFVEHRLINTRIRIAPLLWRPWAPLRGLGVRDLANRLLHRLIYALRGQRPRPKAYGINILMCTKAASRPEQKGL
jgi:2-polyprenyl-3-methyl-5-hydroxy-6-metoxy-1,4-benzoquinol methylase